MVVVGSDTSQSDSPSGSRIGEEVLSFSVDLVGFVEVEKTEMSCILVVVAVRYPISPATRATQQVAAVSSTGTSHYKHNRQK
jgi:hypothetical protein